MENVGVGDEIKPQDVTREELFEPSPARQDMIQVPKVLQSQSRNRIHPLFWKLLKGKSK